MNIDNLKGIGEQTAGLRFDSEKDLSDFIRHSVEDGNEWLARNKLNIAERYADGNLRIVFHIFIGKCQREYELVFSATPDQRIGHDAGVFPNGVVCPDATNGRDHRSDDCVFVGVTNLVQCPEKVIPTLVRLESPHHRNDSRRDILGVSLATRRKIYIRPEGEVGVLGSGLSGNNGRCVSDVVENGPQAVNRIDHDSGNSIGNELSEYDFVRIMNAVRVRLDNVVMFYSVDEPIDLAFRVNNTFLCVTE